MLTALKKRKDEAAVVTSELKDLAAEYEKKVEELRACAETKNDWALGLAFIPVVNVIASSILQSSARKDLAESVAKQKETEIQYAVAKVVTDTLVPALGNFIKGLEHVAGFFEVIHQELTSFQKKGHQAKDAERP